jgi:hypothetical protein
LSGPPADLFVTPQLVFRENRRDPYEFLAANSPSSPMTGQANDPEAARRLWEVSVGRAGLPTAA